MALGDNLWRARVQQLQPMAGRYYWDLLYIVTKDMKLNSE